MLFLKCVHLKKAIKNSEQKENVQREAHKVQRNIDS
jgi:hypothetical protein